MFAELNELLGASPQRPETGKFTLLRDTRTDGSFLVHHFLSFYLRAGCKVCFVALLQSFSHYNIVAQKLGVSLTAARERGQLVFLEGLKSCLDLLFGEESSELGQPSPLQFLSESASNLKALFDFVQTSLTPTDSDSWKGPVLLVDDLSVLLSLGAAPVAVLDFIHYCRVTVCSQLKGNIVVLVHSNEDSEDEENDLVVNSLCHHSDLILWVEGLATGFCKDVHGEIKIIKRVSLELTAEQDHVQIYQYKIQDKNVTFFARGLSAAVL
ncbi:PREDICTED: elongator complex protein 6 isoform X3 [Calidris pugnax]|uniref:elongator complex protein 6 isoform X2 n=1 Tax=Calidris pugnax TaxID=198806 RepID=UPI00071D7C22|nr:PREDICTED: elongator complex protein 6 isoform X2 [Calidris pugnax]XP_014811212.1 PREDICTED: elongator complex protein 6 isoform X3 [Calidris pugnax]